MSDRLLELAHAQAEAYEKLGQARLLLDDLRGQLDDVHGIVSDGLEMPDEEIELLALLPEEELRETASWAWECGQTLLDYERFALQALEVKARLAQGS